MIKHVNAPPGNGKSGFLLVQLEEEFKNTNRNILVWSLELNHAFLVKYLSEKYPERAGEIGLRLRCLTFEEGLVWWRYRGADNEGNDVVWEPVHEWVKAPDGRVVEKLSWPSLKKEDKRCCYFLDEWAEAYNMEQSGAFTPEHRSALRQHRKMGSDVWVATPFFQELAKPYREIGQAFYTIRNTGYEQAGWGRFNIRMPTSFMWQKFRRPPTSDRDKAYLTGTFRLQPNGIHGCYKTASGAGVSNEIADQDIKREGLHWSWAIPAVCCGLILLVGCLHYLPRLGVYGLMHIGQSAGKTATTSQPTKPQPARVVSPSPPMLPAQFRARFQPSAVPAPAPTMPVIEWVARSGGDLTFGLDNGETIENPRAVWTGKDLFMSDGKVYHFKPKTKAKNVLPSISTRS